MDRALRGQRQTTPLPPHPRWRSTPSATIGKNSSVRIPWSKEATNDMKRRMRITRALMCVYPKAWRSEYGCELASTLYRRPLTAFVIVDVLRTGIWQRLRFAAPWQLGGVVLMVWMIFGSALNSVAPLSPSAYNRFFDINSLIYFLVGYRTILRSNETPRSASFASGKTALVGILPEIFVLSLWAAKLIHPTVLDLNGSPSIVGSGFTDFGFRLSKGVPVNLSHMFVSMPLVCLLPAMMTGYIGAVMSDTISFLKKAYSASGG
jgi:hypothetical protein